MSEKEAQPQKEKQPEMGIEEAKKSGLVKDDKKKKKKK